GREGRKEGNKKERKKKKERRKERKEGRKERKRRKEGKEGRKEGKEERSGLRDAIHENRAFSRVVMCNLVHATELENCKLQPCGLTAPPPGGFACKPIVREARLKGPEGALELNHPPLHTLVKLTSRCNPDQKPRPRARVCVGLGGLGSWGFVRGLDMSMRRTHCVVLKGIRERRGREGYQARVQGKRDRGIRT
ncbi:hypothetical protein L345_18092, partial [Ophiophagus hannah]